MTRYFGSGLGRSPKPEFDMATSVFLRYFDGRDGSTIISVYTAYIAWNGLICVVSVHDGIEQRLIDWIDLSSL